MALAGQEQGATQNTGGVPAGESGAPKGAAGESGASELSTMDAMQKRINGLGRVVDTLSQSIEKLSQSATSARGSGTDGNPPADKKLEGAAALEAMIQQAKEQEERVIGKQIRTAIVASMVENGMAEPAARKLVSAMQSEAKFVVNKETDEVTVDDGSGSRPVSDFVRITLQRDDWRVLVPAKPGAKPLPRGGHAPATGPATVQPNESGVFSGAAIRAAAGM